MAVILGRFTLTILNAVTVSIALGTAYVIHKNPDLISPISSVSKLTKDEEDYIRSKFTQFGVKADPEKLKFYKMPYEKNETLSIGIVGSLENGHVYVPEPYLYGPQSTFGQAYPKMLQSHETEFSFKNSTLESANQNEVFQKSRKKFMKLENVFPESYEEIEMNIKSTCYKLKHNTEFALISAGLAWISGFTIIHQIGTFIIKPLGHFPLLPCAFGIGGMVYRGWKISEEAVQSLCDSPQSAAVLVHQTNAEIVYNKQRKKYLPFKYRVFISSSGNDWMEDLLGGPTTRKLGVAQTNLLSQVYKNSEEDQEAPSYDLKVDQEDVVKPL